MDQILTMEATFDHMDHLILKEENARTWIIEVMAYSELINFPPDLITKL